MAIVLGFDIPVLEFLLILNIIMLFYIVISMFEIRSLVRLRKDLELLIEEVKGVSHKKEPEKKQTQTPKTNEETEIYTLKPEPDKNQ